MRCGEPAFRHTCRRGVSAPAAVALQSPTDATRAAGRRFTVNAKCGGVDAPVRTVSRLVGAEREVQGSEAHAGVHVASRFMRSGRGHGTGRLSSMFDPIVHVIGRYAARGRGSVIDAVIEVVLCFMPGGRDRRGVLRSVEVGSRRPGLPQGVPRPRFKRSGRRLAPGHARSRRVAVARAPPAHIVTSAVDPSARSSSCSAVVISRLPVAPTGCPRAMAPPFTFSLVKSGL